MPPRDHATISPPDNLLPAQLGIVLVRRPILGHASATLISLAQRGLLKIAANDDDWLVGTRPRLEARPVASFEKPLLSALPPASESLKFNEDTAVDLALALHKFADGLVKDAVHRGWLRHLHHDQLASAGEDLAVRSGNFRAALRKASIAGDAEIVVNHLPYALTFGFLTPDNAPAEVLPLVRLRQRVLRPPRLGTPEAAAAAHPRHPQHRLLPQRMARYAARRPLHRQHEQQHSRLALALTPSTADR